MSSITEAEARDNFDAFYAIYKEKRGLRSKKFYTHVLLTSGGVFALAFILLGIIMYLVNQYVFVLYQHGPFASKAGPTLCIVFGMFIFIVVMTGALISNSIVKSDMNSNYRKYRMEEIYDFYPELTYKLPKNLINM